MATLTTITLDADGTIGATILHNSGSGETKTGTFYPDGNAIPDGGSTTYIANDPTETTGEAWFSLENVDADFFSMDTLDIDIDVEAISFDDDTCLLTARIFDADNDTTNPLTDETATLGSHADSTRTQRNVSFANLAGTKAQWNSAYIRFTWTYAKVTGPDNGQLRLFGLDIDGTYMAVVADFPFPSRLAIGVP